MEDIVLDSSSVTFITLIDESNSAVNCTIVEEETRGTSVLITIFLAIICVSREKKIKKIIFFR